MQVAILTQGSIISLTVSEDEHVLLVLLSSHPLPCPCGQCVTWELWTLASEFSTPLFHQPSLFQQGTTCFLMDSSSDIQGFCLLPVSPPHHRTTARALSPYETLTLALSRLSPHFLAPAVLLQTSFLVTSSAYIHSGALTQVCGTGPCEAASHTQCSVRVG